MAWNTLSSYTNQPVNAALFSGIGLDLRTHGDDVDCAGYGESNINWLNFLAGDLIGTAYTVTGASWAGGIATYTIGTHNIVVNQNASITGASPSGYNQNQQRVTGVTATTLSIQMSVNPGAWTSGGTVTVVQHLSGTSTPTKGTLAVDSTGALNLYTGSAWAQYINSSLLTTKGDLIAFGTVAARLGTGGAGNDGFILTADSTQTLGVKWAAGGAVSGINSRAHSSGQSISSGTNTALTFGTNDYDNGGVHSTSVNPTRFTVPSAQAGKYLVIGAVQWPNTTGGSLRQLSIRKNGTTTFATSVIQQGAAAGANPIMMVSDLLDLAAADYIEFMVQQDTGGNLSVPNSATTFGSMIRLN